MSDNKYLAIGDVHGCLRSLQALMEEVSEYEDRTFVFVGDYIDRGPASKEVVDYLLEFRKEQECVFIRGNHEQMLLDAYEHGNLDLWLMNGGRTTLNSYGIEAAPGFELPEEHIEFYKNTLLYYNTPNYFFVHAGLSPGRTVSESVEQEQYHEDFLWERSHLDAPETAWEKPVVFGHTPRSQPIDRDDMIGIDTGCVFRSMGYGKLTAVLLPERTFIQQDCLDQA